MAGVGDLVERTEDGRIGRVLSAWAIRRSSDTVCVLHHAQGDEEREFLGWALKPRSTICQWFRLKTTRMVFSVLASKLVAQVSRFGPQNQQLWFDDLDLKIIAVVSWFGPQNQAGFGLSVAPQNRWMEDGAGHTSRSGGLLHV
jgi:hypothetical protein